MAQRYTDVPIVDARSRPTYGREVDQYGREYAGRAIQEQDAFGNRQVGDYEVYQSRGPVVRGERRAVPGEVGKDRDFMTSYGGATGGPRGGLEGIDYSHDIRDSALSRGARGDYYEREEVGVVRARPHSHRREVITERSEYPTTAYVEREYRERPEYTTTERTAYVSRSAVPAQTVYTTSGSDYEYDEEDFPSYEYGQATTTYVGATSAVDYIDERRGKSGKRKWNPICDMGETPTYWLIRCEIPGVRKDRLQVEVEGKDLIIKGKRVKELWNLDRLGAAPAAATASGSADAPAPAAVQKFKPDPRMANVSWLNKERGGKGTFKRRVRLPERVDNSAIQALYKDGVLEVLVKKPAAQARKQAKAQAKTVQIQHS